MFGAVFRSEKRGFISNYLQLILVPKVNIVCFRTFLGKAALPIDEECRKEIGRVVKSCQCLEPPVTLFDKAQAKIEQLIDETTYPNFLKSDMYLQYLDVSVHLYC